ncbi:NUDIX hydrolase [Arcticibacterium luteifluviistationis]|uniref:NUDIX hydrolase n=1 Tax=Arcticibacterium luteifluviistationis TaxID=1784714 RepID=A0A2Z4G9B5_9BACT|nr:NUDIX domain-containing protein [Arcticibacterium luteifluviistationis]AWV97638.1 NUDIX hydrolase [Arcticibacterium luteifluviistationis]
MKLSNEIIDALSIDCVIFGFKNAELYALIVKHGEGLAKGQWSLPGSWIKYNESLDEAASRILSSQTALDNVFLEQFKTFGDLDRFPDKRVITITYYALVNIDRFELEAGPAVTEVRWFNVREVPSMSFDHGHILDSCFAHLQHKIQHEPLGFNLLPEKFTLLQLQELYEAILGQKLDKSNFRRKFSKMNLLVSCNEREQDVSHRAAMLYRFDEAMYNKLIEKGFTFEI